MPEITRERITRGYGGRDRDDYSSDDDRSSYGHSRAGGSSYRTVQRYRVTPDRVETVEDARRSSRVEISRPNERIEIDRRTEVDRIDRGSRSHLGDRLFDGPERPRSAIDIRPSNTYVERDRIIKRERDPIRDTTYTERTVEREREAPRESTYIERDRIVERERDAPRESTYIERDRIVQRERDAPRETTYVERDRIVERERDTPRETTYIERDRTIERDREPFREPFREPSAVRERQTTTVVERDRQRSPENLRPWERSNNRPWEDERNIRETDVRIEKRTTSPPQPWESERDVRETDVRIEKRTTERREEPYELERIQREIEYYDRPEPPPQPIIIRQRAPEPQQIIVQEAPTPAPIIIPREEPSVEVVRRTEISQEVARPEPRREEEDYYYSRRDVRQTGPARDDEYAMARYDRREIRPHDSVSDYSDGEDYVVRRRVIRHRSRSESGHRKRHLAEGALAGAGIAALVGNHREKVGNGPEHRGRNVVGGAALGAIGAEVVTRARSRYREHRSRSRSRSTSRHSHTKIKTALGVAVAGLAAAAAAKYVSNRNTERAELGRGRSRTRSVSRRRGRDDSYDSEYETRTTTTRSKSKHTDPKHRNATIAKAGAATAAIAAVAEHVRSRSRRRSGSRSKSRIRKGAEIAGAGLAGAAVAGLYENRKGKDEEKEIEHEVRKERRRSRSASARSVGAYSDPGVDPELGMVQYGTEPVYTHQTTTYREFDDDRGHRSRSHRRHSSSSDDRRPSRSRSRSRVRDIAGAAVGTAAAAIGVNQYKKRKEKKEAQRERERRRYEEEPPDNYYARDYPDDGYSPSPPHASGGSYYPEQAYPENPYPEAHQQFQPPPPAPGFVPGFTQHPNTTAPNVSQPPIPPYNPADHAGQPAGYQQPHDAFGYPPQGPSVPRAGDNVSSRAAHQSPVDTSMSGGATKFPYFPPPPTSPFPTEQPRNSEAIIDRKSMYTPPSSPEPESDTDSDRQTNKSVMFAPLSPTSERRLSVIRHNHQKNESAQSLVRSMQTDHIYDEPESPPRHRHRRRRRNSDPSSNRPTSTHRHRRRHRNASRSPSVSSSEETEVLPDRFDEDGRPLERSRRARSRGAAAGGGQTEMVERLVKDFGDVVEGRKSWKDMLKDVVLSAQGAGLGGIGGGGSDEERRGGGRRRR